MAYALSLISPPAITTFRSRSQDPAPTAYDPNDPKGKQQAIHKAESFAEYLAKRNAGGAAVAAPAAAAAAPAAPSAPSVFKPPVDESAAKAAWLAKQDAPAFGSRATFGPQRMSSAGEEAAKAAWLAKMDAPAWSKAAEAVASASASAAMTEAAEEACDQGVTAACDGLSREEEAKRAYAAQGSNPSLAD